MGVSLTRIHLIAFFLLGPCGAAVAVSQSNGHPGGMPEDVPPPRCKVVSVKANRETWILRLQRRTIGEGQAQEKFAVITEIQQAPASAKVIVNAATTDSIESSLKVIWPVLQLRDGKSTLTNWDVIYAADPKMPTRQYTDEELTFNYAIGLDKTNEMVLNDLKKRDSAITATNVGFKVGGQGFEVDILGSVEGRCRGDAAHETDSIKITTGSFDSATKK